MTPKSRQRRIAYIRKIASRGVFRRHSSDRAAIHSLIQGCYSLLVFFGFGIWRGFRRDWFQHDATLFSGHLYPIGVLLFTAVIFHTLIKCHWALKVLDLHRVDNLDLIPAPASFTEPSRQANP